MHQYLLKIYLTNSNQILKNDRYNSIRRFYYNIKRFKISAELYNIKGNWKIKYAIDIQEISHYTKLDFEQIKQKHLNKSYDVQIIGFLPGFLYLGDIDKSLNVPRKNTPRTSIPKGSVAIAGNQTGIYNINSPGGWNIIGKTPLKLFNKSKIPPIDINQGDKIIFHEIKKEEFKNYWFWKILLRFWEKVFIHQYKT